THSPAPRCSHRRKPTLAAPPNPRFRPTGTTSAVGSSVAIAASAPGLEPLSTITRRASTPSWPRNACPVRTHRSGWFQWTITTVTGELLNVVLSGHGPYSWTPPARSVVALPSGVRATPFV